MSDTIKKIAKRLSNTKEHQQRLEKLLKCSEKIEQDKKTQNPKPLVIWPKLTNNSRK